MLYIKAITQLGADIYMHPIAGGKIKVFTAKGLLCFTGTEDEVVERYNPVACAIQDRDPIQDSISEELRR